MREEKYLTPNIPHPSRFYGGVRYPTFLAKSAENENVAFFFLIKPEKII